MTSWDLYCAIHCDALVVLGQKCEQSGCLEPATALVHWISRPVRCCDQHTAVWRDVASAMGLSLHVELLHYQRGGLDDVELRFAAMELT